MGLYKLKDSTGIFHDVMQPDKTITGKAVVELDETSKVKTAYKNGVLEKASKDELAAWEKSQKKPEGVAAPAENKELAAPAANANDTGAGGNDGGGEGGGNAPVDYSGLTVVQLKEELEKRGFEITGKPSKDELIGYLQKDDEEKAAKA